MINKPCNAPSLQAHFSNLKYGKSKSLGHTNWMHSWVRFPIHSHWCKARWNDHNTHKTEIRAQIMELANVKHRLHFILMQKYHCQKFNMN